MQPLDEIPLGNNSAFDDKPIPKSNFNWSEYPEGEQVETVQETHYSMKQMLNSKANKLKLSGLEELLKMLTDDPNN